MENNKSLLLTDTEGRGNIEAMMDYIIAWTFKMCDINNHGNEVNEKLLSECRKILSKLIGFDVTTESFSICTYLEWRKIDLVVEIYFNNRRQHVFLIENKVNSKLQDWQLSNNKKIFKNHYDNDDLKWEEHFFLICAHKGAVDMSEHCRKEGYQLFALEELTDYQAEDVGNNIFDEFWRRDWGE